MNAGSKARAAPEAIAFDAYGTLVYISDRRRPYERLVRQLRAPYGEVSRAVMREGLPLAGVADRFGPGAGIDLAALEEDLEAEVRSVRLFADVEEALRQLTVRGFRLALVSNLAPSYSRPIEDLLAHLLEVRIYSFEAGAVKPDTRIFRALCERLALPPEKVLMVGDNPVSDVEGARGAGMSALLLDRDGAARAGALASLQDLVAAVGCPASAI